MSESRFKPGDRAIVAESWPEGTVAPGKRPLLAGKTVTLTEAVETPGDECGDRWWWFAESFGPDMPTSAWETILIPVDGAS